MTLTVVVNPVAVLALRINPTTVLILSNKIPLQTRATDQVLLGF